MFSYTGGFDEFGEYDCTVGCVARNNDDFIWFDRVTEWASNILPVT